MRAVVHRLGTRFWVLGGAVAALLLVVGANAHLLYVAFEARPDCVDHIRMPDETRPGEFRAAKSAC
ncbi:hypothetical protein [Nitratireductor luteus]|uniref:hypothetical protein n=1 Tax=Nitratireductor luteus TaxID=2976980 RepID=UPI00223FF512|nr:hypothetical protein [Nitratireductor luteus]